MSFAIGLVVIGFYWTSHHAAFDKLAAVDRRYVLRTVGYLGLVAFLPYPIRLVGTYDGNPLSWVLLAVVLAAVSGMETALLVHSAKAGLLRVPLGRDVLRWEVAMSVTPVPMFLIGAPLAFVHPVLTRSHRRHPCRPPPTRVRQPMSLAATGSRYLDDHRERSATGDLSIGGPARGPRRTL